MSLNESSETGSEARAGPRDAGGLGHVDPEGLPGSAVRYVQLSLPVPPHRSGLSEEAYQGDLVDACSLWLPMRVLHPSPRWLVREPEEGSSAAQGVGPIAAQ